MILLALWACGSDCEQALAPASHASGSDAVFDAYDPAGCTPDQGAWNRAASDIVSERCGSCHGAETAFGAPLSLTDYDALLQGDPGNRPVDRIARRVATHTMPPPTSPQLDHVELDSLVAWATCGEVHPDPQIGLKASRDPYDVRVPANLELPSFDVVAEGFALPTDALNRYQCFSVAVPIDEPRLIKRMQVVLGDARVLHHVVLMNDPHGDSEGQTSFDCEDDGLGVDAQLWAWAPGTGAFDFADGGMLISPGQRLIAQVHYNNAAGLEGVVDRSGVRVFHGPVAGPEWTLAALGPDQFEVSEGDSAVCSEDKVFAPRRLLAGLPHMHELGAEFGAWVERKNGDVTPLVRLTGWSFEAQLFYPYDVRVDEGDVVHTRCGYRNETGQPAKAGIRTEDEMCFDFVYVGPP